MISATQIKNLSAIRLCLFAAILLLSGSFMTVRANVFAVTNTNDNGPGSFREAIMHANASPGADTIIFGILPKLSLKTIVVQTDLPAITDPLTINGFSEGGPGYEGPPLIELRAGNRRATHSGLSVSSGASHSLIRGLIVNSFPSEGIGIDAQNVTVAGCYVGTSADGNSALPNGAGIGLGQGAGFCLIGGPNPHDRNVLSGNQGAGFKSYGGFNRIEGNYIGVSASGSVALGNDIGIDLQDWGNNRIGGNLPALRNVISGNHSYGISISFGLDNRLRGNYIGTAADGLTPLGNQLAGIHIEVSPQNQIGGGSDSAGNVISANGTGIEIENSLGNTIQNNLIGVGADTVKPLGNLLDGISIVKGTNTTIGGRTPQLFLNQAGNTIAFNGRSGVRIDEQSVYNLISLNSIHHNLGLGIDLLPEGVTANDSCDADTGANSLKNFPVIESVTQANGVVTVTGSTFSPPKPTRRIEFFSNSACNAAGFGEGEQFIGSVVVESTGDCGGQFSASFNGTLAPGAIITATETDAIMNTSEFSPCFFVPSPIAR
jgi:hypothetical protein